MVGNHCRSARFLLFRPRVTIAHPAARHGSLYEHYWSHAGKHEVPLVQQTHRDTVAVGLTPRGTLSGYGPLLSPRLSVHSPLCLGTCVSLYRLFRILRSRAQTDDSPNTGVGTARESVVATRDSTDGWDERNAHASLNQYPSGSLLIARSFSPRAHLLLLHPTVRRYIAVMINQKIEFSIIFCGSFERSWNENIRIGKY